MSVLVLGSLHADVVVRADRLPALDETLMGRSVDYRFGGKGGNQALAAAAAGARAAFAGAVGTDAAGDMLLHRLAAAGVETSRISRVATASGMSVAIETASGDYGAVVVTGANAHAAATHVALPSDLGVALIQNEVPEAANLALAAALPRDVRLILNAAPFRAAEPALLARVDVLVVNRVEAAQAGGAEALARGCVVIETLGAEGCRILTGSAARHVPAPRVSVASTHGAGDVFCGRLAAGLDDGRTLEASVTAATQAAAAHVEGAHL